MTKAEAPVNELRVRDLSRQAAHALAEALENAAWPEPLAITLSIVDEPKDRWSIVALYEPETTLDDLAATLADAGQPSADVMYAPLPDADWVRQSLEGLPPVHAGRFCLYGSHDRHRRPPSGIAIEIDAGTAFGTGHHATTKGCLLAIDLLLKRRTFRHVLDVGCGTGVLAIAAALACPKARVLAGDIDPEAVRVTRLNAALNGAAVRAVAAAGARHPLLERNGPYDLILANILARPLTALAPPLMRQAAPSGAIVLSGLLTWQERMVEAAWRNAGAVIVARLRLQEWSTLILARPSRRAPNARPRRLIRITEASARYPRRRALP